VTNNRQRRLINAKLEQKKTQNMRKYSCRTVTLMVLGPFSDICGTWSANIRKLTKDHKSYGSAAREKSANRLFCPSG
jgi:hypothetical protein